MSLENAFSTESPISRGRGRGRDNSRGKGRSSIKYGRGNTGGRGQNPNTSHPSGQKTDKLNIQCHYYKKYGHCAYECRKRQYNHNKQGQDQPNNTNNQTNPMFMVHIEVMAIVSPVGCNVYQASPCDIWYFDSGCSNHMT
jgi:hypothetical protein